MRPPIIEKRFHNANPVADLNRKVLRDEKVFTVNVVGGPGCGKTSLIDLTIERLMPEVHVGVIACDVASHLDADRMSRHSDQVIQVNTGLGGIIDATHIRDALEWLDVKWLDLLFIENVGTLVGPGIIDLGQDATAAVFSVAGGHDKTSKHPELVRDADVVVLNKVDLIGAVPFDLPAFRDDVRQINPRAKMVELSALRGDGVDAWLGWLSRPAQGEHHRVSNWFG